MNEKIGDIKLPDKICDDPCVYIGGFRAASNVQTYSQIGITHVINCAGDEYTKKYPKTIKTLIIKAKDDENYDVIGKHLNKVKAFFESSINDGINSNRSNKYMFHCIAGVNRSVTLCVGYLMYYHKRTVIDTVKMVHSGRTNAILTNKKFVQQLAELQIILEAQNLVPTCRAS